MRKMIHLFFEEGNVSIEVSRHAICEYKRQCDLMYKEDLSYDNIVVKIKALLSHTNYEFYKTMRHAADDIYGWYINPNPEDRIVFTKELLGSDARWKMRFIVLPDNAIRIVDIDNTYLLPM